MISTIVPETKKNQNSKRNIFAKFCPIFFVLFQNVVPKEDKNLE